MARLTWLRDWSHGEQVTLRVLCLPGAGTAAHTYRRWSQLLPADIGVVAVELPGHGSRLSEPPVLTVREILEPLAEEVAALADRPLVIFGHSMGAAVGAELARLLRRERGITPALLIAAAREAPRPARDRDYTKWLSEDGARAFLREMGGTPPELLGNEDYVALMLPPLRADLAVLAGPWPEDDRPLDCPVRVYLGDSDTGVRPEEAAGWRAESNGDFAVHTFDSGHFFVHDRTAEVLARLCADVTDTIGSPGPRGGPAQRVP
ncbi:MULTISPECIES: thioesterase II family protein [Streptomyces]|uniref:Alpha/beta fold hydrolase n=1 Tax=Streptomyces poriferorum TaxID=2798799 RepID=A0ABY9IZF3_9ACTN|nr:MULTISPECIES: alpha/beta fold hydrolase [Streptomyces]MBW5251543.1 thioesterase [Streptomyces poriferorum]MBW5258042.1 thioesterase [Streptomyces poriferorum]MDP5309908.1 alpha/beta fold hydrolase [Streptomyces sp. Alt4]WLQ60920.1 alpha/beta fold hydrolase [Streptomyces sp. Alt2]WSI61209.1 alpha/beta fold hydrolase [Streptomyces sp. NBC_01336]